MARIKRSLFFALLLRTCLAAGPLAAQSFKVLVLDAVSGKPQSGMDIDYMCQGQKNTFPGITVSTDTSGIAVVAWKCRDDEKILLSVTGLPKEQCGGADPLLTLNEILSVGYIAPTDGDGNNLHCTNKIRRKLKPVPGQVIIFTKKANWWEARFGAG